MREVRKSDETEEALRPLAYRPLLAFLSCQPAVHFPLNRSCHVTLFPPQQPQEAGYDESAQLLVEDVMMSKNVPDPRDIRKYDLIGVFGMVNYRTLRVSQGASESGSDLESGGFGVGHVYKSGWQSVDQIIG